MLTLNDGRSELWQWDTGRKLTVDADCSQVHFSNKVFGRSIDLDVVDGVAVIPDILLQTDKDLNVWAFVGTPENGYTKISKVFKVNKRNKPADYVFTPPEQTTLEEIKEKLDYLESIQDPDAIKNAVDEYLANNPIQIDEKDPTVPDWAKQTTKPKYTATEVGAVAKVNGVKPDANGNVEITIPDSGGNVDLTGYATEQWVKDQKYLTAVPDGYAKTSEIPKKPEDIGALPNTYTPPNQTAQQVGADPAGTAANAVSGHNSAADAHADIRLQLMAINDRLNSFLDIDDQTKDQLSEVIALIVSNKDLIDAITTSKVSVLDIVNDLVTNVPAKPLSAAQGVVLKGLIDALSTGKLDASKLQEAINTALAQAKASGEFDGANGQRGTGILNTTTGIESYTTAVGGVSSKYRILLSTLKTQSKVNEVLVGDTVRYSTFLYPVIYVDSEYAYMTTRVTIQGTAGTSVTVESVTESSESGGSNVVTFSGNKTLTVKNGKDGYNPVRGTDYWTDADQEAIVQQVITALGTPVFGRVDKDNNIILTGELADGTYTIKYEDAEGNVTTVGTLEHDADAPNYTNQIPISTDTDGSIYNGVGYKANTRGNSSGAPADISNTSAPHAVFFTGFIPAPTGSVIRLKNCFIFVTGGTDKATANYGDAPFGLRSGLYNASKAKVAVESWGNLKNNATNVFSDYTIVEADGDGDGKIYQFTIATSGISFVRLCLAPTGDPADAVVTVNEEIID